MLSVEKVTQEIYHLRPVISSYNEGKTLRIVVNEGTDVYTGTFIRGLVAIHLNLAGCRRADFIKIISTSSPESAVL